MPEQQLGAILVLVPELDDLAVGLGTADGDHRRIVVRHGRRLRLRPQAHRVVGVAGQVGLSRHGSDELATVIARPLEMRHLAATLRVVDPSHGTTNNEVATVPRRVRRQRRLEVVLCKRLGKARLGVEVQHALARAVDDVRLDVRDREAAQHGGHATCARDVDGERIRTRRAHQHLVAREVERPAHVAVERTDANARRVVGEDELPGRIRHAHIRPEERVRHHRNQLALRHLELAAGVNLIVECRDADDTVALLPHRAVVIVVIRMPEPAAPHNEGSAGNVEGEVAKRRRT